MLRTMCCATLSLLLSVSCSPETKTEPSAGQASAVPKPAPAPAPASAAGATADSGTGGDPFAADYASIRRQITRFDGDTAKLDEARQRIMDILARDRGYAPAYVALARIEVLEFTDGEFSQSEVLQRATKLMNHALKLDPNLYDAHRTAAWIAVRSGDYDLAEESLRKAEELKPGHPPAKLLRAWMALQQEEALRAVQLAREVAATTTADDDDRADAYRLLTLVYESGLHLEEADAAYRKLLELRPDSSLAHGHYAELLLHRDDVDGAIREAEAAANIRKYPQGTSVLARSYLQKAQELWDANRIAESASYIQKVAGLAGDNADLSYALGVFYEGAAVRGRDASMRRKALASYKRALEINPRHIDAERAVHRLARTAG